MQTWMRASDADRERVVAQLQDQVGEGRLTLDEFSERTATAYRARTIGELADLTRDLPASHEAHPATRRRLMSAPLLAVAVVSLLALVLLVGGLSAAHAMGPMMDCMGR